MKKDDEEFVSLSIILFSDFPGLSASSPVPRKRDLAHTYRTHNPLNSRGFNGKRTEHQIGGGVHLDRHPRPCCSDRYMIEKNSGRDERAGIFSSQPPEISLFLAVLLYNFSFKYFRHSLVLN